MKKILLLILGMSVLGLDGIAQHGKGKHGGKGKNTVEAYHGSKGNSYGRDNGRTVVVARRTPAPVHHSSTVVVARKPVYYDSRERITYRYNPGIRYVRHVTIAPRPYIYVDIDYRRVKTTIVSVEEVDRLVENMYRVRNDHDRLNMAKDLIRYRMVYAEDVAYIIDNLEFDEHRLELAKFAFRQTVDKENYETVRNRLEYKENRKNLDHYLGF